MVTSEFADQKLAVDAAQPSAGAVAGVLNGSKIIYGTNTLTLTKTNDPTTITQVSDTGLAPAVVTWGTPVRDDNMDIVTITGLMHVQLALSTNACVLKCWGITDTAGTNLLLSGNFQEPLNLQDNLSQYGVQIPFCPAKPANKEALVTS